MSLRSSLKIPLPGVTVVLKPFPLYLFNKQTVPYTPYLYTNISEQHLKGSGEFNIQDQLSPILNSSELEVFLHNFFYGQTVNVSVHGETTAKIGALSLPITMEKTITIGGECTYSFLRPRHLVLYSFHLDRRHKPSPNLTTRQLSTN